MDRWHRHPRSAYCLDHAGIVDEQGPIRAQSYGKAINRFSAITTVAIPNSQKEIHLTVRLRPEQRDAVLAIARDFGCKVLMIELARGDYPIQPMLSWRQTTDLEAALNHAKSVSRALKQADIEVIRIKIEADLAEIGLTPARYAEAHFKLRAQADAWPALTKLCADHGAHLSRNAWSTDASGERRFATIRETEPRSAASAFAWFQSVLTAAGWQIESCHQEAVLYDDNLSLDQGWLQ